MDSKYIFKAYAFFYRDTYKVSPSYSQTNQNLCIDFIQLLTQEYKHLDSIGIDFLWNYFIFHFEYWKKLKIEEKNNKKIDLSYIIGKRAFNRYLQRDQTYDWQIQQNAKIYNQQEFIERVNLPTITHQDVGYDADELYRVQQLNTELGLSNCITFTSLWSPSSKSCQQCIFQEQCTLVQRQIYPKINRNRKIANVNQQQTTTR